MRIQLTLAVAFLATNCAFAEPPKPNTLTAKEIAEGWILLFDGETTIGWKVDGEATVNNGELKVGGLKESSIESTPRFEAFLLQFESRYEGAGYFHISMFGMKPGHRSVEPRAWQGTEVRIEIQNDATLVHMRPLVERAEWNAARLNRRVSHTSIGFAIQAEAKLYLRNVKLKPLGLNPLFNGKDLNGWKQYSGDPGRMKSKFTVTPEGWLNVQGGSGDLGTETKYADFVFQGECICNGKHLNSGVFFRCLPDQYLQGYEMQILNKWEGDNRNKPVDFGTGAIYRRQPARKVVSTDGEWFAFTIAAQGRHIATWINGEQVTDWTDLRPEKENAREGAKLGAGHFSIQGHDPTTNLSFRNLRVAELKK